MRCFCLSYVVGWRDALKAYLSSTYADLVDYRDRAYRAMRRRQIDVVAMEDYVAGDERPLDKCLRDVEKCDLYVGVFAFRYGFVPTKNNPDGWSVTEHEYRRAVELGIPRLLFCLDDEPDKWSRSFDDHVSGDNERGARIDEFRDRVKRDRISGLFKNLDDFGAKVTEAVAEYLFARGLAPATAAAATQPAVRMPRPITHDLTLLHAPADAAQAAAIARDLATVRWAVRTEELIGSTGVIGVVDLDARVSSSRAAAVLLSPAALALLNEDQERTRRALAMMRDRTGVLWGFSDDQLNLSEVLAARFTEVVAPAAGQPLAVTIRRRLGRDARPGTGPEAGLPVMIAAMTAGEADDLFGSPPAPLRVLLERSGLSVDSLRKRYRPARSEWQPFPDLDQSVTAILESSVQRINEYPMLLRGHAMRLQPYPLDAFMTDANALWELYESVAAQGCLLVVDELSLFHEGLGQALRECPLTNGKQVAMVSVAPPNPSTVAVLSLFEEELGRRMTEAARRFGERLDPLCEIGVPEQRRLSRWLHLNLPGTLDMLRSKIRDTARIDEFQRELGMSPSPALGRAIAGERDLP
jgi:hypothetical protein